MTKLTTDQMIMMPIPISQYTAVCALLGGAAVAALSTGSGNERVNLDNFENDLKGATGADQSGAAEQSSGGAGASPAAIENISAADGEIDAHGHPWSADLHASTKGKTKDGLWRMKVGVSRPDPLPGFPKQDEATGTATEPPTPSATSETAPAAGGAPDATGADEDEFAAFRAAAEQSNATDEAAAAAIPQKQYSDADLGALCNQAAVKLGDPGPIKTIIAAYVPEGQVTHSRNIPPEKRAAFVAEVEQKAGVQFAG